MYVFADSSVAVVCACTRVCAAFRFACASGGWKYIYVGGRRGRAGRSQGGRQVLPMCILLMYNVNTSSLATTEGPNPPYGRRRPLSAFWRVDARAEVGGRGGWVGSAGWEG